MYIFKENYDLQSKISNQQGYLLARGRMNQRGV